MTQREEVTTEKVTNEGFPSSLERKWGRVHVSTRKSESGCIFEITYFGIFRNIQLSFV